MPLILFALQVTNKNPLLTAKLLKWTNLAKDKGIFSPAETRHRFIQIYKRTLFANLRNNWLDDLRIDHVDFAFSHFAFCVFLAQECTRSHVTTHTHNISHGDIAQHRSWRWLLTYPRRSQSSGPFLARFLNRRNCCQVTLKSTMVSVSFLHDNTNGTQLEISNNIVNL